MKEVSVARKLSTTEVPYFEEEITETRSQPRKSYPGFDFREDLCSLEITNDRTTGPTPALRVSKRRLQNKDPFPEKLSGVRVPRKVV
jgi:hypothetical protein